MQTNLMPYRFGNTDILANEYTLVADKLKTELPFRVQLLDVFDADSINTILDEENLYCVHISATEERDPYGEWSSSSRKVFLSKNKGVMVAFTESEYSGEESEDIAIEITDLIIYYINANVPIQDLVAKLKGCSLMEDEEAFDESVGEDIPDNILTIDQFVVGQEGVSEETIMIEVFPIKDSDYYSPKMRGEIDKFVGTISDKNKGVYLVSGEYRTGKSSLLAAISKALCKKVYSVPYYLVDTLLKTPDFYVYLKSLVGKHGPLVLLVEDLDKFDIDAQANVIGLAKMFLNQYDNKDTDVLFLMTVGNSISKMRFKHDGILRLVDYNGAKQNVGYIN